MKEKFDVVIVGGGMVGAALACGLGGSRIKTALIENEAPLPFAPEQAHDLRVSALSIASKNILLAVGAWDGVAGRRYCPFRRMRVWEESGVTEFCSRDIGYPELGYIVENRIVQLALLERAKEFDNVELICPAAIDRIDYRPDGNAAAVALANGRCLAADLLVAADGGQSKVRQALGFGVTARDYAQHALVLYVATEYGQQDITWQHFVPSGPQAFLPLPGPYASLVWYHSPEEVQRLKSLNPDELKKELTAAFPDCLGPVNHILATASFPLRRQHAQAYVKEGAALIGDAAHIINPLAGQGVNIGLLDAAALAEVLLEAKTHRIALGNLAILRQYEKRRRFENLKMMAVMDAFYEVFSNDIAPLKLLRNIGFNLADRIRPAKHLAMRAAMGLDGRLPKLARGESPN